MEMETEKEGEGDGERKRRRDKKIRESQEKGRAEGVHTAISSIAYDPGGVHIGNIHLPSFVNCHHGGVL